MELTAIFKTSDQQIFGRIAVPGKGYFKDFQFLIYGGADLTYISVTKSMPENEDLFPSADGEEMLIGLDDGFVVPMVAALSGTDQYWRGRSEKRIFVKEGDILKIIGEQGSAEAVTGIIQATFVPVKGEVYKIKRVKVGEEWSQNDDDNIEVPIRGMLKGISLMIGVDEATGSDHWLYRLRAQHIRNDSKIEGAPSSFDASYLDAIDLDRNLPDEGIEVGSNILAEVDMAIDGDATGTDFVKAEKFVPLRRFVDKGDVIYMDSQDLLGTGTPDSVYYEIILFIQYLGDRDNQDKGEYMLISEDIKDIIDLGVVL